MRIENDLMRFSNKSESTAAFAKNWAHFIAKECESANPRIKSILEAAQGIESRADKYLEEFFYERGRT